MLCVFFPHLMSSSFFFPFCYLYLWTWVHLWRTIYHGNRKWSFTCHALCWTWVEEKCREVRKKTWGRHWCARRYGLVLADLVLKFITWPCLQRSLRDLVLKVHYVINLQDKVSENQSITPCAPMFTPSVFHMEDLRSIFLPPMSN